MEISKNYLRNFISMGLLYNLIVGELVKSHSVFLKIRL